MAEGRWDGGAGAGCVQCTETAGSASLCSKNCCWCAGAVTPLKGCSAEELSLLQSWKHPEVAP